MVLVESLEQIGRFFGQWAPSREGALVFRVVDWRKRDR